MLKPGQCFAAYEWCMTDHFDPNNESHNKTKAEIELGNGLPDIRTTRECLDALKLAGFEVKESACSFINLYMPRLPYVYVLINCSFKVVWEKDLAVDSPVSWYLPLDTSKFSITSFRLTAFGRFVTRTMVHDASAFQDLVTVQDVCFYHSERLLLKFAGQDIGICGYCSGRKQQGIIIPRKGSRGTRGGRKVRKLELLYLMYKDTNRGDITAFFPAFH